MPTLHDLGAKGSGMVSGLVYDTCLLRVPVAGVAVQGLMTTSRSSCTATRDFYFSSATLFIWDNTA